jgi:hypothetical protein
VLAGAPGAHIGTAVRHCGLGRQPAVSRVLTVDAAMKVRFREGCADPGLERVILGQTVLDIGGSVMDEWGEASAAFVRASGSPTHFIGLAYATGQFIAVVNPRGLSAFPNYDDRPEGRALATTWSRAVRAQRRHLRRLLSHPHVVGAGASHDGKVLVFVDRAIVASGLPSRLDGHDTKIMFVGSVEALANPSCAGQQ